MHAGPQITLIAAVARNGVIGDGNRLPWRLEEDMRFFRQATLGHAVLMGRKTWQSLPERFRPLPGRRNLVLSREPSFSVAGAEVVHSFDTALQRLADAPQLFVIGGAQIYEEALPHAHRLLLTEIDHDFPGDVHFPQWERSRFTETSCTRHDSGQGWGYRRIVYQRRSH